MRHRLPCAIQDASLPKRRGICGEVNVGTPSFQKSVLLSCSPLGSLATHTILFNNFKAWPNCFLSSSSSRSSSCWYKSSRHQYWSSGCQCRSSGRQYRSSSCQYRSSRRQLTSSSRSSSCQYRNSGCQYRSSGCQYRSSGCQYMSSGCHYRSSGCHYRSSGYFSCPPPNGLSFLWRWFYQAGQLCQLRLLANQDSHFLSRLNLDVYLLFHQSVQFLLGFHLLLLEAHII